MASTTTTTTGTNALPKGNPKDSMKSTWRTDRTQWTTIDHHLFSIFNLFHYNLNEPIPVHAKTDPVPYLTMWSTDLFVVLHALWPMGLQYAWIHWTGHNLSPYAALFLYIIAFESNSIYLVQIMRRLGHRYCPSHRFTARS